MISAHKLANRTAVNGLAKAGYTNAFKITDSIEGDTAKRTLTNQS